MRDGCSHTCERSARPHPWRYCRDGRHPTIGQRIISVVVTRAQVDMSRATGSRSSGPAPMLPVVSWTFTVTVSASVPDCWVATTQERAEGMSGCEQPVSGDRVVRRNCRRRGARRRPVDGDRRRATVAQPPDCRILGGILVWLEAHEGAR